MSLDGFVAGPNQSVDDPIGVGGMKLHEWVFPLAVWRSTQGIEGGIVDASTPVLEESQTNVGATIMGRNMFGPVRGDWNPDSPWDGWWGKNPPYHHPVFVLTHFERKPLRLEGGTSFTFVTDGIESALDQARDAANGKDVFLAGGARAAQEYLAAELVDEMEISLVPVLLGHGERLFSGSATLDRFEHVRTVVAPNVIHYQFVRR
jgi:dihydrofolate reductase